MKRTKFEQKADELEIKIQTKLDSLASRDSGIDWFKISDGFRKIRNSATVGALIGAGMTAATYVGIAAPETGGTGLFMAFGIGSGALFSEIMRTMSKEMHERGQNQLAPVQVESEPRIKNNSKIKP